MKQKALTIALALIGLAITAHNAFGQANVNLLKTYVSFFLNKSGQMAANYEMAVEDDYYYDRVAALGGKDLTLVDTALEIALLSASAGVIDARPVQAKEMLPRNNPKLMDLTLGSWVFQEIQILRFLGNTAALGRHEVELKIITDRGRVTRAEVEAYYRSGIRSLISDAVDEEFNKISFPLNNLSADRTYNSVLTRNYHTGEYVLSYERPSIQNSRKELSAKTLEALLAEIRNGKDKADFVQSDIDTVKAQAALIPAAALSDAALNEAKTILTNFYITPSATMYAAAKEMHIVWNGVLLSTKNVRYQEVYHAYERVLSALNEGLAQKVLADVRTSSAVTTLTREQQQRLTEVRR
jgi:hypothetical protein